MPSTPIGRRAEVAVGCGLAAWATARAGPEEIAALRKSPGPPGEVPIPPSLLKHADEQTVVGLAAVLRASADAGLASFADWAVLAAPCYLGRPAFLKNFPQYQAEGAWGVSPHLVPAYSLHSPSGTISQVLKAHGTNLGVGGSPGGAEEALTLAATLLSIGTVAGVWVVLTGRTPGLDRPDDGMAATPFEALALALVPQSADRPTAGLRVAPGSVGLVGLGATDGERISAWLAASGLRVDPGQGPSDVVPRPHFGRSRAGVPGGEERNRS